jgi:hypothetical protein
VRAGGGDGWLAGRAAARIRRTCGDLADQGEVLELRELLHWAIDSRPTGLQAVWSFSQATQAAVDPCRTSNKAHGQWAVAPCSAMHALPLP